MANTNAAFGFRPLRYRNGAPWNGAVKEYLIPSSDGTAVFVGDMVKLNGDSGAAGLIVNGRNCEGMPMVIRAAAADALLGAVVGFCVCNLLFFLGGQLAVLMDVRLYSGEESSSRNFTIYLISTVFFLFWGFRLGLKSK